MRTARSPITITGAVAVCLATVVVLQAGSAAVGATPASRARDMATAPKQATGDWGFKRRFTAMTLPAPALVWQVRLDCFSRSGCTADSGLSFGPTDSNGNGIAFTGTTATSEPLVDSLGDIVGVCTSTPAPSGSVTCRSDTSLAVPDGGSVRAATTVTFAKFTPTSPGEPLASSSWSDSPTEANPGDNLDNDEQEIITTPTLNPIEVWIDPTATAFAAGQGPQVEEAGIICKSEGFCWSDAGTTFRAALRPSGVHFPYGPASEVAIDGFDVTFLCLFTQVGGYRGTGTNLATCSLTSKSIVDHYGEAFIDLPVEATAAAYPQNRGYSLVLHPSAGMSGPPIGTGLSIVAPIAITTTSPLPPATESSAYSVTLTATGGVPTITNPFAPPVLHHSWGILQGSIPPGLRLKAGVISGTPRAHGSFTVVLQVADLQGDAVAESFTLVVSS